jgi:hypothetical protein
MKRGERPQYVSATELASLGYCEIKLVLDTRHGEIVAPQQAQARQRGVEEHARFDVVARTHHNQVPTSRGPCWIASAVYGPQDSRTNELRDYRDQVLMHTAAGRRFVRAYYRWSPPVARVLSRSPSLAYAASRMLDGVRFLIAARTRRSNRHAHRHAH